MNPHVPFIPIQQIINVCQSRFVYLSTFLCIGEYVSSVNTLT